MTKEFIFELISLIRQTIRVERNYQKRTGNSRTVWIVLMCLVGLIAGIIDGLM